MSSQSQNSPSPASPQEPLVLTAAGLLGTQLGHPVSLLERASLSDQHPVLRCDVRGDRSIRSVIVKQVTRTDFNAAQASSGVSQRFLNEWACLEFVERLDLPEPLAPRILAASIDSNLLLLEDLGERETLLDQLLGKDAETARASLAALGRSLAWLQSASRDQEAEFRRIQKRLGTASPRSDSSIDFRRRRDRFRHCFETLGMEAARGFWDELSEVERCIHGRGPFRSFLHADAGPHNVLPVPGERARLIDFEFGDYRHGMLDVVSARLGFPHTGQVWSVPATDAEALEKAYRFALLEADPAGPALDDASFETALVDACAHWVLSRWSGNWKGYYAKRFAGDTAPLEASEEAEARHARFRSRSLTLYEGFLAVSEATGRRPAMAASLRAYTMHFRARWPALEAMPPYRALEDAR